MAGRRADLILLDALLGAKLIAERARNVDPNVTVLLCTGDTGTSDALRADAVLYKPVPPPELLRIISALLGQRYEDAA